MNPELPPNPRAELEARLTAYLLGELPAHEAAVVRQALDEDAALARLCERLKPTIKLVTDATASTPADAAPTEPLRLSEDRRQKLLAHFKTIAPKEFAAPPRKKISWLVPVVAAAAAVAVIVPLLLPALAKSKSKSMDMASFRNGKFKMELSHPLSLTPLSGRREPAPENAPAAPPVMSPPPPPKVAQTTIVLPATGEPANAPTLLTLGDNAGEFPAVPPLLADNSQSTATLSMVTPPPGAIVSPATGIGGGGGQNFFNAGQLAANNLNRRDASATDSFFATNSVLIAGEPPTDANGAVPIASKARNIIAQGAYDIAAQGNLGVANGQSPASVFYKTTSGLAPVTNTQLAFDDSGEGAVQKLESNNSSAQEKETLSVAGYVNRQMPNKGNDQSTTPLANSDTVEIQKSARDTSKNPLLSRQQTLVQQMSRVDASDRTFDNPAPTTPAATANRTILGAKSELLAKNDGDSGVTRTYSSGVNGQASSSAETATEAFGRTSRLSDDLKKESDKLTFGAGNGRPPDKTEFKLAYQNKQEELAELTSDRKKLYSTHLLRSMAEAEVAAPQTGVILVEQADANRAPKQSLSESIGGALTGTVERHALIRLDQHMGDVVTSPAAHSADGSYNPDFVQASLEIIQSGVVLDKVIKKLDLNKVWAGKGKDAEPLSQTETRELLRKRLDLHAEELNPRLVEIGVKSDKPEEAASIANAVAEAYQEYRNEPTQKAARDASGTVTKQVAELDSKIARAKDDLATLQKQSEIEQTDAAPAKPASAIPVPQPETLTSENAFSTFSLNVADVSFKLAAASLEKGQMPDSASIRSEEFINAFDYRDPDPAPGAPLGFAWERAHYPFAHNRDVLRFSVKTAAAGRPPGRALNIVLLLDNSGSMERADRVQIIHEALRVLATQLQPQDTLSVVTFARTPRLWVDGVSGSEAGAVAEKVSGLTPQGGTNLEDAMKLAYETALRHYLANGVNRVVLLTDGAANLGNVDPVALKQKAEDNRRQGIALDCFGIGWEGYNDDLLETLSRNGGGRYGFLNTPAEAASDFAGQLAGALNVAAADVKVQIEFNPQRVTAYRQIGYAKHQLTQQQFRDNTVAAAQIGAAESGNALYTVEINAGGMGPIGTVRVRFKVPGTSEYQEHAWEVPYNGDAVSLDQAGPTLRLATTASAFSEWLAHSPYAGDVTPDQLLGYLAGVPQVYGADERPAKLEWMIRQAKSISGK